MKKIAELLNDKEFVAELGNAKSAEELKKMFETRGANISAEQLEALKKASSGELGDDELEAAAGRLDFDLYIKLSEITRNRQIF